MLGQLVVVGLIAVAIVTEASSLTIQKFWQEHPMSAALVSSALVIALTLLVIDEAVARRAARKWRRVAQAAYRELSTVGFDAMIALARAARVENPHDLDQIPGAVADLLEREDESSVDFILEIQEQSKMMAAALAQWSPVMLENSELAEALDDFASMRDALLGVARIFMFGRDQADWEAQAAEAFGHFIGMVSIFHVRRELALGETNADDIRRRLADREEEPAK